MTLTDHNEVVIIIDLSPYRSGMKCVLCACRTPGEAPGKIAYLLERCLAADPKIRPSADHVLAVIAGKH